MARRSLLTALLAVLALLPATALAQSATTTLAVNFPAGYNMVSGPTGTDFSAAARLFGYAGGQYYTPSSRLAVPCVGYWAYFAAATTVTIAPNAGEASHLCAVAAGWSMLGNPFSSTASLPAGVTGWYWNAATASYQQVTSIPAGGAVWVYSSAPRTLTLTNPAAVAAPPTVVINQFTTGPVSVRVGNTIKVLMPVNEPGTVTVDPEFIRPDTAGTTYELTCVGDPACQIMATQLFWQGHAIAAGTTFLTVSPACLQSIPACGAPSRSIEIDIRP